MWLVFSLNNNPEKKNPPANRLPSVKVNLICRLWHASKCPHPNPSAGPSQPDHPRRTWKCQYLHRQTKTCRDQFPHGQFDKLVAFSRREAGSGTHSSFRSGSFPRGSRRHWPRHISHAFFFGRSDSWRSDPPSPEPRGVDDWHSRTTWGWVGEPHQDIV